MSSRHRQPCNRYLDSTYPCAYFYLVVSTQLLHGDQDQDQDQVNDARTPRPQGPSKRLARSRLLSGH